jgi:hypothetical protein
MNIKSILSTKTLTEVGGLGLGEVGARAINSKVSPLILKEAGAYRNFSPALPIVAGILLSRGFKGDLVSSIGKGMIANGAANYISRLIDPDGTKGLGAAEDVMMGNVDVLMGNAPAGNYSSDSYDTSSSETGEMTY